MKKILFGTCLFAMTGLFIACDDEKTIDTTAPAKITEVSASLGDGNVEFSWNEPKDTDYEQLNIEYFETSKPEAKLVKTVVKGETDCEITGLTNFSEYTFVFTAYDAAENASETVELKLMPEVFPDVLTGKEIEEGIYSCMLDANQSGTELKYSHEFKSENIINTDAWNLDPELPEPMPVGMSGTWSRKNDSLQISYTQMYVNGSPMDVSATDIYENAFVYTDDNKTCYYAPGLVKTEGNENSVLGTYSSTQRTIMTTYVNKISIEIKVNIDGTWEQTTISERSDLVQPIEENLSGTWTNETLRNGQFKLITFNDRVYLKTNTAIIYERQE